jgi:glutathionylspermidine synthase
VVVSLPWSPAPSLVPRDLAALRRRAIFECFKWDPQVGDVSTLAPFPLVLDAGEWARLARSAEQLAAEAALAEEALVRRPDLHDALGLPRAVRKALRRASSRGPALGCARLVRFDFHFTSDGWRISEANTDVPGGLNESSGVARLVAEHHPGCVPAGDPAARYAEALVAAAPPRPKIALAHATAFADDNQVMSFLARELESRGAQVCKLSPAHLEWREDRAQIRCAWDEGRPDVIGRFFPGEWLPNLGARGGWDRFFAESATPISNPATALLTQTKRFPLAWDALGIELPTWRALLPETRDPRAVRAEERGDWVVKPALGRVGDGVGIPGVSDAKEWKEIEKSLRRHPGEWAAQRRFEALPMQTEEGPVFPCVGVYTVDGRAAGAYGRVARRALIDARAQDVAVLVAEPERAESSRRHAEPSGQRAEPAGQRAEPAGLGSARASGARRASQELEVALRRAEVAHGEEST